MLQQTYTPSNTGIESFIRASADYDLAPVGIGSMQEQADRLAEFGRNGDVYVVHAAEGETVIPTEVLDANPQVKEMLFAQMRDMGLNPDEYVVGSELNSINPDTGMPEFFFKKIFKSVKKIIKSAAPLIVPLIGNMILPGIGGILASAVYTKATGGSWGDVLKGAAMSYLGGAVYEGFTAPTGTSFGAGFLGGLKAPYHALSDIPGSFNRGILGSEGYTSLYPAPAPAGAADAGAVSNEVATAGLGPSPKVTTTPLPGSTSGIASPIKPVDFIQPTAAQDSGFFVADPADDFLMPVSTADPRVLGEDLTTLEKYAPLSPTQAGQARASLNPVAKPSLLEEIFGDKGKTVDKYMFGGGKSPQEILEARIAADNAYMTDHRGGGRLHGMKPTKAGLAEARAEAGPNIYQRYGPTTALLGVAAYAGGAFDEPKRDPGMSDEAWEKKKKEWAKNKLFAENPGDYVIPKDALNPYKFGNQYANSGGLMELPPRHMNNGGAAQYPRREMLVEGPGTERSDDIPAMLSDGEFVLNSRSVRGADPTGQGNRYRGAQNLYNMMRNFEMRA